MNDDFSDNTSTTGTLVAGATASGTFESFTDCDWFRVDLTAGTTYYFTLDGAATGGGTLFTYNPGDPPGWLALHDGAGKWLAAATIAASGTPALSFTPTASGSYFLEAGTQIGAGSYTVAASIRADDYAQDAGTGATLAIGAAGASGWLERSNDRDWFKVTLAAGELVTFTAHGDLAGQISLGLPLNPLGHDQYESAPGKPLSFEADHSGDFYLEVHSTSGTLGAYSVTAAPAVDDYTANAATSGRLAPAPGVPGSATGVIDAMGDRDWFAATLDANKAYNFHLDGASSWSSVQPGLALFDPAASLARSQLTNGGDFQPLHSGLYYVQVTGGAVSSYTVSVAELADDYANSRAGAAPLQLGADVTGKLDYAIDQDWFALSAEAGKYYQLGLTALNADGSVGQDAASYLTLVAPDGSTFTATTAFQATATGSYSIGVAVPAYTYGPNISYRLSAAPGVADDISDSRFGAAALEIGVAHAGVIDSATDHDVFKVTLQAGTSYVFQTGGTLGSAADIYQPRALSLEISGAASGPWIDSRGFTPTVSGDYYLTAHAAVNGDYSLTAALAVDDFGANPAGAGSLAVGGSVSGALVGFGDDRDWFGVELHAGTTYWLNLAPAARRPLYDAFLKVVDAGGHMLANTGTTTGATTLPFVPAADGTYFVEVAGREDGGYTLAAALGVPDDFGSGAANAHVTTVGASIAGRLEVPDDIDTFKVALQAGVNYHIDLAGGGKQLGTNHLGFSAADSDYLGWVEGYPMFKPSVSGDYLFSVRGPLDWGSDSYTFSVTPGTPDDYADNRAGATWLASGGTLAGTLEYARDSDYFGLAVHGGVHYTFKLDFIASGPSDPNSANYLMFYDERGVQLESRRITGPSTYQTYLAHGEGTVYAAVANESGTLGSYTLHASGTDDASAPLLVASHPAAGSAGAGVRGAVVLDFNETVIPGSGDIAIHSAGASIGGQLTVAGAMLSIKPTATLFPGTTYTLDLPAAVVTDFAGNPLAATSLTFSTAPGAAAGTGGNDIFALRDFGGRIDGGAGLDAIVFDGASYQLNTARNNGEFTFSSYLRPGQTVASGVERVYFTADNHALALDVDGIAGQAYRVYRAAFDRAPDEGGLGFWIGAMDHGVSLRDVAAAFVGSAEFQSLYGSNPSDADFVDRLYQNILHRPGEQAGVDYWVAGLKNGVARPDMLAMFSESVENHDANAALIGNGFLYQLY